MNMFLRIIFVSFCGTNSSTDDSIMRIVFFFFFFVVELVKSLLYCCEQLHLLEEFDEFNARLLL